MSPCLSYINKVYQLIGPSQGPVHELITNLNFYANDMCIGSATSFVTQLIYGNVLITSASMTREHSDMRCHAGSMNILLYELRIPRIHRSLRSVVLRCT